MSSAETRRVSTSPADKNELTHKMARTRRIVFPQVSECGESLPYKPADERLFPHVAVYFRDGLGQRDSLGTRMHAVLCVRAFLDAAGTHQRAQPLALVHRSRGVHIKKSHLADDGRAHELILVVHLRANFQAVPAGNTIRERIALFLNFGRYAWAFTEIVRAVDGNPGLHPLKAFEHELPIDSQIAHQRKLRHRLDSNRLLELVDQRRTCHARLAVDEHRAGAANLFKTMRVVRNRRRL